MKQQMDVAPIWQAAALRARLARTKARIRELRAARDRIAQLVLRAPRAPRRAR
jgi:hypothetical protein